MMSTFRIRKNKDNPYIQIHKAYLSDKCLSWRAKGILTYLLSKPDNWIVQIKDIKKHAKEGDRAVRKAISELMDAKYLNRKVLRGEGKGNFIRFEYDVYESPDLNNSPFRHFSKMVPLLNNDGFPSYHDHQYENQIKQDLEAAGLTYTQSQITNKGFR